MPAGEAQFSAALERNNRGAGQAHTRTAARARTSYMDAESEDQTTEQGDTETEQETRPRSKLRDLKPEKDTIGAGGKTAGESRNQPRRN